MNTIVSWIEASFEALPLPLLEVWGRLGYFVGFGLMICAFGGFTLRPGGRWGLGRERQAWDAKAFLSIPLTFVLIVVTGYIGSFLVLVPGAQTFESLKDLVVFLCVVLFGYPALITVPFAYGLSDLIEGVPPLFLLDWLAGYFINPTCFWIAYQLFGKDPDFRRVRTWGPYLGFVLIFMAIEPVMWGYICSDKFTPEIAFRVITPALFFTTGITWLMAPAAMLGALPLARKLGLFWADIAGHVKERPLGGQEWAWESGRGGERTAADAAESSVPIRMVILAPFIVLVLLMVGATAYVTLRSAAEDADRLAARLHQEIAENINLQLDERLSQSGVVDEAAAITRLLGNLPVSAHGRAFIMDRTGRTIASSAPADDPLVAAAIGQLGQPEGLDKLRTDRQFRFTHVTAKPLSRETWLARATAYQDRSGGHSDWIVVTAMPEAYYLAGIREGNSRSAMIFALALLLSLAVAAVLAWKVTTPVRRISDATRALAEGDLAQQLPGSPLEELNILTRSFNDMAGRLKKTFDDLSTEVEMRKRAEQRLRQERDYADAVLNSLPGVFYHYDDQLRLSRWNRNLERISGYSAEELAGIHPLAFFVDEEKELIADRIGEVFEQGESSVEAGFLLKDRRCIPYLFTGVRFEFDGRQHLIGVGTDLSERKKMEDELRESLARFHAAARATGDVLWDWDLTTNAIWWNENFQILFGYAEEEIEPTIESWTRRIHPDDSERVIAHIHTIIDGTEDAWFDEYRFRRKDGNYADLFDRGHVLRDKSGHGVRMVGAMQDITERKQAQARLLAFNAELEQRVAHRTRELQTLNQELESFCYSVSHDLRSPLRAIAGFSEILAKNYAGALDDKAQDYLSRVLAATHRMGELIDDLLELSRVSREEMRREAVDLSAIAREILANLQHTAPERRVEIAVEEGLSTVGDARLLRIVLENLLGNAWKFTSKTSAPRIAFTASNEDGKPCFVVSDNGAGFDMRYADKLFGPFQRLHRATEFPGTGIGLATVERIVTRHGGRISAEAEPGKGATFRFSLGNQATP